MSGGREGEGRANVIAVFGGQGRHRNGEIDQEGLCDGDLREGDGREGDCFIRAH